MNIIDVLEKKRDNFFKIRNIATQQEELLSDDSLDEYISLWKKGSRSQRRSILIRKNTDQPLKVLIKGKEK